MIGRERERRTGVSRRERGKEERKRKEVGRKEKKKRAEIQPLLFLFILSFPPLFFSFPHHRVPRKVVDPPLDPQLRHRRVDPREPRPRLAPRLEQLPVVVPGDAPADRVALVAVVSRADARGDAVVELAPQQLPLERDGGLRGPEPPLSGPGEALLDPGVHLARRDAAELEVGREHRRRRRERRRRVRLGLVERGDRGVVREGRGEAREARGLPAAERRGGGEAGVGREVLEPRDGARAGEGGAPAVVLLLLLLLLARRRREAVGDLGRQRRRGGSQPRVRLLQERLVRQRGQRRSGGSSASVRRRGSAAVVEGVGVPERVRAEAADLDAGALGERPHRRVARAREGLRVLLERELSHPPGLPCLGELLLGPAAQHHEPRPPRPQARVEVAEALEQEAVAVDSHVLRLQEVGVEHEDREHRRRVSRRRGLDQGRVVVEAQALDGERQGGRGESE